jgi:inner membrane protein
VDSITHILSAALWTEPLGAAGRPGAPALPRWRERMAVALGALLPDADGLLGLADMANGAPHGWYAKYHRVVSHSLPGLTACALVAAWLAWSWPGAWMLPSLRGRGVAPDAPRPPWRRLLAVAAIAVAMHLAGDAITAWGTLRLFWPLSDWDAQLGRVNSIDPWLLALTVTAWAAQHVCLTRGRRRAAWLTTALWLALCALYVWLRPLLGPPAFT